MPSDRYDRFRPSVGRFVDGKFTLDRLIAATAATPEAVHAISKERVERLHAERAAARLRVDDALAE